MNPLPNSYHQSNPYRRIALSFILAAAAVTGLIFYYTLGRAVIVLELEAETEVLETNIITQLSPDGDNLPSVILTAEKNLTKTYRARGTGAKDDKASGTVTIINNSNSAQTLIATTRLLSSNNILFRINKQVTVPAGGSTSVEVVADKAGDDSQITESTKFTIPGLNTALQQKIYAESKDPLIRREKAGGKILASDIEDARNNLKELITQQALAEMRELLPTDKREYSVVYKTEITKATSSEAAESVVSEFDFDMAAKVSAIFYEANKLREVALATLNSQTADTGKQVLSLDEQSLAITITNIAPNDQSADLTVKFLGHVSWKDVTKIINKDNLLGRTQAEVENYFSAFPGVKSVEVKLSPFWVTSVPTIADHIELNIK